MNNFLLSICVPTFNRSKQLVRLINSMDIIDQVELVICDDGSTDDTKMALDKFSKKINLTYFYQENQGRGFALKKSIKMAKGEFVIVMDSDDYFTSNALANICWILRSQKTYKAFVFGIKIMKNKKFINNLPPDIESNYISLRGDYGVKHDLKEVVSREILQSCLYSEEVICRRVPTFLIWSSVAEKVNCLSVSLPVAVKEYLPGGMTDQGFLLRMECAIPMTQLYSSLTHSKTYNSSFYRWLMRIMWARYALHAKKIKINRLWMKIVFIPGLIIFLFDRLLLSFLFKHNNV
ncbi:glycosyltransferase family 2 protein [Candidatus Pseudothioglobus singularis]|nr:glycosyltransferase family 2 protein [Candidatus Pseudothioglobus singularis]